MVGIVSTVWALTHPEIVKEKEMLVWMMMDILEGTVTDMDSSRGCQHEYLKFESCLIQG
jgi:hypothetical protein